MFSVGRRKLYTLCMALVSRQSFGRLDVDTFPETNIAPENGWLEYWFPFGMALKCIGSILYYLVTNKCVNFTSEILMEGRIQTKKYVTLPETNSQFAPENPMGLES